MRCYILQVSHLRHNGIYAIALLGCFRVEEEDQPFCEIVQYCAVQAWSIYTIGSAPTESLLLLDLDIKISARVDCILQLSKVLYSPPTKSRITTKPFVSLASFQRNQHGFCISEIWVRGEKLQERGHYTIFSKISKDLGYDAIGPASDLAIIFSNDGHKRRVLCDCQGLFSPALLSPAVDICENRCYQG
jgi:hypothetical protein